MRKMTRLRLARVVQGISQVELMRRTGISNVALSHIENGYYQPRSEVKAKLARALKLPVEQLFFQGVSRCRAT